MYNVFLLKAKKIINYFQAYTVEMQEYYAYTRVLLTFYVKGIVRP